MRSMLWTGLICLSVGAFSGCIIPAFSADPVRRAQQLIYTSEDFRLILDEWERLWMLDQPGHTSPYRTHGGII